MTARNRGVTRANDTEPLEKKVPKRGYPPPYRKTNLHCNGKLRRDNKSREVFLNAKYGVTRASMIV